MVQTNNTQKKAAKSFVQEWSGKGYEKGETQRFWFDLLHAVFGVDNPTKIMKFELPVKTITKEKGSDFIDTAVMDAYGFPKDATESDIVALLFKIYQELTQK